MNRGSLAALTGAGFFAFSVAAFVIGGEPPAVGAPARDIVDFYVQNAARVTVGAALAGIAGLLLVFFGGHLRSVLSAAEGRDGMLATLALVGTAVMAVGIAIDATITLTLAQAAGDIAPAGVEALRALWDNDFIPIALGTEIFLLSTGISFVRHGGLPRWLGWVALALAATGLTPVGFVAFIGGGIWILVVSIMLTARGPAGGATS